MNFSGSSKKIIVGSRQSDLARIQAQTVGQFLKSKDPELDIEFFNRPSFGDLNLDMDLAKTDSRGVFTQEFKDLLKNGSCDIVVHSWKDLPIEDSTDTEILTLSLREDQRDLLFLKKSSFGVKHLKFLTSSPRREFQLTQNLKDLLPFEALELQFEPLRGNIPTRFSKFLESNADGFVVAKAAVDRLMGTSSEEFSLIRSQILEVFESCHWMVLPLSEFPTAAAQGALAVEILKKHPYIEKLKSFNDQKIYDLVSYERNTHRNFGGGCHQAMGFSAQNTPYGVVFFASGEFEGEKFKLKDFKPNKVLKTSYEPEQLFSQTELKSNRTKRIYKFSDLNLKFKNKTEFVVTRFEARLEDLKSKDFIVWVSGTQTWKKLATEGYWINGSLDGLGVAYKPSMDFLNPPDYIWLSNSSSPEESIDHFKFISTYDLTYNFSDDLDANEIKILLQDRQCFLWMSGHAFESVLAVYPDLKNKTHFCGLGRTGETLKKHLKADQIYFCLNEEDFVNQCLKRESYVHKKY